MLVSSTFLLVFVFLTQTYAIELGERCQDSFYCSYIINAECRDSTCQCLQDRTIYQGSCVQGYEPSQTCLNTAECILNDVNSICVQGACHCQPNHHMRDGKCMKNRGLYEYCISDIECYNGEDQTGLMECSKMQCSCKAGYEPYRGRRCSNSTTVLPTAILTVFTIFFGLLLK